METYSSKKMEVIASCPGPLFDFPRSMRGGFRGVTQKRHGDLTMLVAMLDDNMKNWEQVVK